eukprot:m.117873 g.117873  ORF g.117873 m.117873 type:complete len:58 (+) comp10956_c1_seq1:87-260(+)
MESLLFYMDTDLLPSPPPPTPTAPLCLPQHTLCHNLPTNRMLATSSCKTHAATFTTS